MLLLSDTFDSVGLMGRSVADVEQLDAVLTEQPRVAPATLAGLRLAVPRAYYCDGVASTVAGAFEESLARLRGAGCTLVDVDVAALGSEVAEWHLTIVLHEADRFWRAQVRRLGQSLSEFASEIATARVREAFELLAAGGAPSQAVYQDARDRKLPSVRQSLVDYFNATGAAALVAPASPIAGPAAGQRARSDDDALFELLTRNMLPATIAAQPSICIPIGANDPVGLLLDGRPGEDRQLLALALAAEPALRTR